MTITVNFIEGSRKSICRNDAWSVVRNDRELIDIIPCEDLRKGQGPAEIKNAFRQAATATNEVQAPAETLRREGRRALGLCCG